MRQCMKVTITFFSFLFSVLLYLPLLFRYCFFFLFLYFFQNPLDDPDYYYGGSMRDLTTRRGNRRKSSSASHIGKKTIPRTIQLILAEF